VSAQAQRIYNLLSGLLLALAFCLPISIALAEPLAFLIIPLWIYAATRERRWSITLRCPLFGPVMLFVLMAVAASFFGVRPSVSIHKFHRLLLFLLIFVIHDVFGSMHNQSTDSGKNTGLTPFIFAFISGAVLLGAYDVIRVPLQVWQGRNCFDTGNMRDPQFYLVALSFLCAYVLFGTYRKWPVWMAIVLTGVGLILHFKRGVWLSFLLGMTCVAVFIRKWKPVALILFCALLLLLVPQVRERLGQLHEEFQLEQGGRFALWTQVTPALLAQHPHGMGFCAMKHEDFVPYAPYIQPKLSHLHNNLLQIAVETGWLGLGAWLLWMTTTFLMLYLLNRRAVKTPFPDSWIACGALGAFSGLMINGLVESNISDTEILMLLCLIMGMACVLYSRAYTNHFQGNQPR